MLRTDDLVRDLNGGLPQLQGLLVFAVCLFSLVQVLHLVRVVLVEVLPTVLPLAFMAAVVGLHMVLLLGLGVPSVSSLSFQVLRVLLGRGEVLAFQLQGCLVAVIVPFLTGCLLRLLLHLPDHLQHLLLQGGP